MKQRHLTSNLPLARNSDRVVEDILRAKKWEYRGCNVVNSSLAKGESILDDVECKGCNVVNSRQENGSRDSVRWKAADGFGLTFW